MARRSGYTVVAITAAGEDRPAIADAHSRRHGLPGRRPFRWLMGDIVGGKLVSARRWAICRRRLSRAVISRQDASFFADIIFRLRRYFR